MIYINNENEISSINLNDSFMVFDFDRTITKSNSETSWSVIENSSLLPDIYRNYSKQLYNYYRKFEIDTTISDDFKQELMEEWMISQLEILSMFFNKNLFSELLKCASNIEFKEGISSFFDLLNQLNIPVIVISAGLGNIIKEAFKINNCLYDNVSIISNMLVFNKCLKIDGPLVISTNKANLSISSDTYDKIRNKDTLILFGDQISDLTSSKNFDVKKQVSIGFISDETAKYLEEYKKYFDIICTGDKNYNDLSKILIKKL